MHPDAFGSVRKFSEIFQKNSDMVRDFLDFGAKQRLHGPSYMGLNISQEIAKMSLELLGLLLELLLLLLLLLPHVFIT